jgi:hypothetical protein
MPRVLIAKLLANGDELANHLSRNNALHEYSETQEEVLIAMLKSIQPTYLANPDDFRQCDAAVTLTEELRAKMDKNSRLQKVMRSPNMCMMLSHCLLPMGHHFRRRREFSVTWLSKSMGICMGVSTHTHRDSCILRERRFISSESSISMACCESFAPEMPSLTTHMFAN